MAPAFQATGALVGQSNALEAGWPELPSIGSALRRARRRLWQTEDFDAENCELINPDALVAPFVPAVALAIPKALFWASG